MGAAKEHVDYVSASIAANRFVSIWKSHWDCHSCAGHRWNVLAYARHDGANLHGVHFLCETPIAKTPEIRIRDAPAAAATLSSKQIHDRAYD